MSSTIGMIAGCNDCEWREEDYKKDVKSLARKHARKHKHYSWVEITRVRHYNKRGGGSQ